MNRELVHEYQTAQAALREAEDNAFLALEAEHAAELARIEAEAKAAIAALTARIIALETDAPPVEEPPIEEPPDEEEPEPETPPTPNEPTTGIWTNIEEIKAIDTTWPAWKWVETVAKRSWQSIAADGSNTFLGGLNDQAAGEVVMGMIYYIRTGDAAILAKVIKYMDAVFNTKFDRTLELGRKQTGFAHAYDLMKQAGVKWDNDARFRQFIAENVNRKLPGHAGHDTIFKGARFQPMINWGRMQRAAVIATSLALIQWGTDAEKKLGQTWLDTMVKSHKWDIGEPVAIDWTMWVDPDDDIEWYPDNPPTSGINRRGAKVTAKRPDGSSVVVNVSGAIPGDLMRGSADARWPFVKTGYNGEGGQALVVCAVMLDRAGLVPFGAGDNALVRMSYFLHGMGEAATNDPVVTEPYVRDDNGINWLINTYAGLVGDAKLPEQNETSNFKGTGGAQILSLARRKLKASAS
jgi:hypothetical protein